MMSFRRYVDATAIAQLLGRMVRTPIHQRILVDDMLNDVQLFLPHFDAEKVKKVVDELQNEEGGELPTDIIGDEIEHGTYIMLTTKPTVNRKKPVDDGPSLFDQPFFTDENPFAQPASQPSVTHHSKPTDNKPETHTDDSERTDFEYDEIDRPRIVEFINGLALPSYQVRPYQQSDYLKSLFSLCRFLLISGLDVSAKEQVVDAVVERINSYVQQLKQSGKYAAAKEQVVNFEMLATVYDAFGELIKADPVRNMFSETDVDIERQLRIAERQLGNEGVAIAYGRKYDNPDNQGSFMVDVILFVCDEEQMKQLHAYAKAAYHQLNDKYRQKTTRLSDALKTQYRNIVRDSAEISDIPFYLGENIMFRNDEEGDEYTDHLFVNEKTGSARIRLNNWERQVIDTERQRNDFRCWYRNPSRGSDALALYHNYKGTAKQFYPDFLIIRKENGGDYILDILEPHDPTRDDNVSKAKALARYTTENAVIGRAQLIRLEKTATGETIKRLDFAAHSELREKVMVINNPEELDNLFVQYGE
jgi:type III restriction enzyme